MEDINVKSYNDFDAAIATTRSFNNSVEEVKATAEKSKATVSNDGIFKGPAATTCSKTISHLMAATIESMDNYKTMNRYLHLASANYQAGDADASQVLLMAGNGSGFKTAPVSSLTIPDSL